jgi:hypothetical protein
MGVAGRGFRVSWQYTTPPRDGRFIVVDRRYRFQDVAYYSREYGWCIAGRWLGHDAAECWDELQPLPPRPATW